ncbi:hypothetical protein ACF0H5_010598 [Mactra antiquata]
MVSYAFMYPKGTASLRVLDTCDDTTPCPEESQCLWRGCDGRKCICKNELLPSEDLSSCVKGKELGSTCEKGDVCLGVPFSDCIDSVCICLDGYRLSNDKTHCVPRMKGNATGAEYDQSCAASNVMCVFDLKCVDGKCVCASDSRIKTKEEMFAAPYDYRLCVPESFRIGTPVNVSGPECQKPGTPYPSTTLLPTELASISTASTTTKTSSPTTTSTTTSTTKPTTETSTVSTTQSTTSTKSTTMSTTSSPPSSTTTTSKSTSVITSPVTSTTSPTEATTTIASTPPSSTTATLSKTETSPTPIKTKQSSTTVSTSPSTPEGTTKVVFTTTKKSTTSKSPSSTTASLEFTSPETTTTASTTKRSTTSTPSLTTKSTSQPTTSTIPSTAKPTTPVVKSTTLTVGPPSNNSTVGLGEPCQQKACPENSECVLDACNEARCQCALGYANSPDEKTCWKLATLGELCGENKVCQGANTICSDRGICECESGFERSDSGRWCRLKSSWFIKFPVIGEECSDSFSSQCYMYFEQECIAGKCRCKDGYREVATIPDQNAVYPDTAQCRNASFHPGEREALLCNGQSKTRRDYDVYSRAKSKIHRIQGAIIGGSVGFVALLGIVIGILVLIRWKRKGRQQMIRDTSSTASTDATSRYSFKIPRPFAHFVGSKEFDSTQIAYPNTIFDKEDREEQVNNEPKPDVVNVGTLLRQSQNQT